MENGRGPGLPRSFVDDPFFQQHQRNSPSAEFFRDFPSAGSTRRFGSNPRLFDNGDRFFDDFGAPNDFNSLPRRTQSRSPRPASSAERPIHVQRQGVPPTPPPPSVNQSQQQKKEETSNTDKQPTVHVINVHPAVEINNSPPSSYTNGRLNPDRQQADAASLSPNPSEASSIEKPPVAEKTRHSSGTGSEMHSTASQNSSQASQPSNGVINKAKFDRKTSIEGCSEQLIHLLDDAELRVEKLRETASLLEQEKEQLLDVIHNLKLNTEILRLGEGDRDDINATAERILKRCKAVDVVVNTPRNEEQTRALDEVNNLIQLVHTKMQEDLLSSKDTVQRFLNACSPDEPNGPIDQRFQAKVVECTADDQKKIRRRLAQLISQIDRAERSCNPNF